MFGSQQASFICTKRRVIQIRRCQLPPLARGKQVGLNIYSTFVSVGTKDV